MANKITADIEARGADKTARDLAKVGDSAAKAGDQLEDLGKDSKQTGVEVDGLTKKTKESSTTLGDMAKEAGFLDREISRLQGSIASLTRELDATGDTSLLKDIRKDKRQLGTFSKLSASIGGAADVGGAAATVGVSFGTKFMEAAGTGIKAGGPYMAAALGVVALSAVPFLGAAIGAAVLGGVGAGGLIGGITLAAQDPRVKAAGSDFATAAMSELRTNIGAAFVEPTIEALGQLRGTFTSVAQEAAPAFSKLALEVKPLSEGVSALAKNAMPGFVKALEAGAPLVRTISAHLPKIGDAIGGAFDDIASGGDGAIRALDITLTKVENLITTTGEFVGWLGRTYDEMARVGEGVTGDFEDILGVIGTISPFFSALSDEVATANDELEGSAITLKKVKEPGEETKRALFGIAEGAEKAAQEAATLNDEIDTLFGRLMNADQAALAAQEGLRDLRKEWADGERSLRNNTAAGDENRQGILDQIALYARQRDANAQTSMGLVAANALYEQQVAALRSAAVATGFQAAAVDGLIAKYQGLPRTIELTIGLRATGSPQAWSALRAFERQQDEAGNSQANPSPIERRASGGPTTAGRTYLVGENGPELWSESSNGYVTNAAQTAAMMSGSSGGSAMGGGGSTVHLVVSVRDEYTAMGQLAAAVLPYLKIEIGNQGGSSSAVLDTVR